MEKKTHPLVLKRCLDDIKVSYRTLSRLLAFGRGGKGWSASIVSNAVNGTLPKSYKAFISDVTIFAGQEAEIQDWLESKGLKTEDLFRMDYTPRHIERALAARMPPLNIKNAKGSKKPKKSKSEVTEMLTHEAKRRFKVIRDPFIGDVQSTKEVYMSSSHMYLKEAILDTAKFGGFMAVVGAVGTGKSTIRKAAIEELKQLDIAIIELRIIDKKRITASHLLEAIIRDLRGDKIPASLEAKSRAAYDLLHTRSKAGQRTLLLCEEMHLYTIHALKMLKQLYELELGYKKMLGIVGLGQEELYYTLDSQTRPDLREVIQRMSIIQLEGLTHKGEGQDELLNYLELKFKRVNIKLGSILTPDAIEAIREKLTDTEDNVETSIAYPLAVNNLVVRAMNEAARLGESTVTSDIIWEV